ncbi:MAG: MBG domain-containing protein, partial [Firmicutes bacterium]|nr:MBG domain-containing protein [Bacillota bacterium]
MNKKSILLIILIAIILISALVSCVRTPKEIVGITAENVEVDYNGEWHKISVLGALSQDTVSFSSTYGTGYGENNVELKDSGFYIVYYKVERKNHKDFLGNATIRIKPLTLRVTPIENQFKILNQSEPKIDFKWEGNLEGETPRFTGALERQQGEQIGEYIIRIGSLEIADSGNFKARNYSLQFEGGFRFRIITATDIQGAVISLSETVFTYSGSRFTPEVVSVVLNGKNLTSADYTVSYQNNLNAGTARVTITGKGAFVGVAHKDFTILKATPNHEVPEGITTEYRQGKLVTEVVLPFGWYWHVDFNLELGDSGLKTFSAIFITHSNSSNYNLVFAEIEVEVKKARGEGEIETTGWAYGEKPSLVYITNPNHAEISIEYRKIGFDIWDEMPPKDAGDYEVRVLFGETLNHLSHEEIFQFSIEKAEPIVSPKINESHIIYAGGTLPDISLNSGSTEGNIYWDSSEIVLGGAEYLWFFTPSDSKNFKEASGYIFLTAVEPEIGGIFILNNPFKTEYTAFDEIDLSGTVVGILNVLGEESGLANADELTVRYASGTHLNFKDTVVYISYQGFETTIEITVNKADMVEGTHFLAPLNLTAVFGDMLFTVVLPSGWAWVSEESPTVGGAGERIHPAIFTHESENFNPAQIGLTVAVARANGSGTVSIFGWNFGTLNTPNPSVTSFTNQGAEVTYEYRETSPYQGEFSSTKPSEAGTYEIKANISATDNYNGFSALNTFTISRASGGGTVAMESWVFTPNSNETPNPIISSERNGTDNVIYEYLRFSDNISLGSIKPNNAGQYRIRATFSETRNYFSFTATTTFVISKAIGEATLIIDGWAYGSLPNSPIGTSETNLGAVAYSYKLATESDESYVNEKPINAQTYVLRAVFPESSNYEELIKTVTFVISKFNISGATISIESVIYTGNAYESEDITIYIGNITSAVLNEDYTLSGWNNSTNAGTASVNITGAGNNFEGSKTVQFTINPRNISGATINISANEFTYDGSEKECGVTHISVDGHMFFMPNFSIS